MATESAVPRALAAGLATGLMASVVAVVPALGAPGDARLAEYVALLIVVVGTLAGLRFAVSDRPGASYADRIAAAVTCAGVACVVYGAALWGLYAIWRPSLLRLRYDAQLVTGAGRGGAAGAAALADLAARQAQYLDPLFQALTGAVTAFFFAMLVGGYAVVRWRVASRVAAARRSRAP